MDLRLRRREILYQVHRAREGDRTVFHLRRRRQEDATESKTEVVPLEIDRLGSGEFVVGSPAGPRRGYAVRRGDAIWVELGGATFRFDVDRGAAGRRTSARPDVVASPMPGQVLRVLVEPGQRVEKGDTLLIVEAMKMQIEITAPHAGIVRKLPFRDGAKVEAGIQLAEIEPETGSS